MRRRAPGLDGVRALAVLAVMAFHEGLRAAPGGFLGVDVFFVLSGYLITDLLVVRYQQTGRLGLRGFWARRARRLLPALAAVLVTVTAAVAVIEPGQLPALRPALLAAVTYSSNWYQALHHVSYFASFGPPPPLEHLWSLSIEEQFYLAWPIALILVLSRISGRLARASAAWLGAAASAVAMAVLYRGVDPSLVYYGTDTHATPLLVGAALALTWPLATVSGARRERLRGLDLLGIAGLAVLAWETGHFSGSDPVVYPFGLVLAALAAGALTVAAAARGAISALLSLRPLRWLGVRSYGVYLWHWPVIALAAALTAGGRGPSWLWLAESVLAILLAAASWKWLEAPILRDGVRATFRSYLNVVLRTVAAPRPDPGAGPGFARPGARGRPVTAGQRSPARAFPAIAAVAAALVVGTAGYGLVRPAAESGLQQQVALGERISAATRAGPATASPAPSPAAGATPPAFPVPAPRTAHAAARRRVAGSQVTAVGDSVMLAAAQQLAAALPGIYIDAQVSRQMSAGLLVVRHLAAIGRLRRVVVVGLGTNGTVTPGQVRELLRIAGPHRELVLINTFEARPWEQAVNRVLAATARHHRNVVLANWRRTIEHRTNLLWGDGVHPRPPGARVYARMVAAAIRLATRPHKPGAGPTTSAPTAGPAHPVAARGSLPSPRQAASLAT